MRIILSLPIYDKTDGTRTPPDWVRFFFAKSVKKIVARLFAPVIALPLLATKLSMTVLESEKWVRLFNKGIINFLFTDIASESH